MSLIIKFEKAKVQKASLRYNKQENVQIKRKFEVQIKRKV